MPTFSLVKRALNYRSIFGLCLGLYLVLYALDSTPGCQANAAPSTLEYCFVTEIIVENTGDATLTDQPVRVMLTINSLIAAQQMDARAWDVFPIIGSANNELGLTQQSITSNAAPWWFNVPSLAAGQSRTIEMFSGKADAQRSNGVRFYGSDTVTVTDSAFIRGTANFQLTVELTNHDATFRTENIVQKLDTVASPDDGYRLRFLDVISVMRLQVTLDDDLNACTLDWNNAWNDEIQVIDVRFVPAAGNDLFIDRNGVNEAACDTDNAVIDSSFVDLEIGDNDLTGATIDRVSVLQTNSAPPNKLDVLFLASDMTETSSVNPYSGTLVDTGDDATVETVTYTFNRPQTALDFTVGVIQPNLFEELNLPTEGNSVVGAPVTGNFATPRATVMTGVVSRNVIAPLQSVASATGAPPEGVIAAFFFTASLILAIIVWRVTGGFMPAAVLTMGIGPTIAVVLGFVDEWWLLIWGLTIAVVWFAQLRSQSQS